MLLRRWGEVLTGFVKHVMCVEFAATLTSEKGVRLAQKMQVGPCIPVGIHAIKG